MNKTELDRKYYPQYLELLNLVQEGLKIEVNTELDFNGDFIDKRVPELTEKERNRLYQEADIIPFKALQNDEENPRKN